MAVHDSDYYSSHPAACESNASSSNLLQRVKSAETAFLNKQYQEALEKYKGIDNSHSRYMVGLCIANLECHYFMPDEAEEWFRKSAEENNPWAQYILDDEEDLEYEERLEEANQAMHSYLYSYNGGDWEKFAMYEAAMCFRYGKGVKPRARTAFDLFKKASSFKCPKAQYELGLCYKDKIVEYEPEPNIQALYHFYIASRDVPEAYYELAYEYYNGDYVVRDYEKVVCYLGYATSVKHPPAFFLLGNCYLYGYGVAKDEKRAAELFRQAVDLGNVDACKALAKCYHTGCGVEHDAYKAFSYYLIAAERGDAEAQVFIGDAYLDGISVPPSVSTSAQWYKKAAANGNSMANNKLALIRHRVEDDNEEEVDSSVGTLLDSYEPGHLKLRQISYGVNAFIHMPLRKTILFLSKEARIEAIFFIFAVIKKYLEEEFNFRKMEPCLYALCYCLREHGMEKSMSSLVKLWQEEKLPSYFRCTKGYYGENWRYSPFFDYQEWVKLLLDNIKASDPTCLPPGLFSSFVSGSWEDSVRNALEEWYMLLMFYGLFKCYAEHILNYDKEISLRQG